MDNFWKLVGEVRSLLIVGGLGLFAFSLVGQIAPYTPVMSPTAQIVGCIVGLGLMLGGIWFYLKDFRKNVRGIRILSPADGDKVQAKVPVRGEIQDDVPEGKELWLLRIYPNRDKFVPMTAVHPRANKTWDAPAKDCNIAGLPGEKRIIGAYIVDPSAVTLFTLFIDWRKQHDGWMDKLNVPKDAEFRTLQPIKGDPAKMENMKVGHEVEVERV
jgi:hypothetical protein